MSTITIYNKEIEFDFQSIDNWKTQGGDPYAFPVNIGGHDCFVKQFIGKPPRSREMLKFFDDRETKGIPNVFEYFKSEEQEIDQDVYYLVQKFIPGKILHDIILPKGSKTINLESFAKNMIWALEEIHSRDHWHCDICFKNILTSDYEYTLIDLDSCLPLDQNPDNDHAINHDLISGVIQFFKDNGYLFNWEKLSGDNYNYLQVAMAILHLSRYNSNTDDIDGTPRSIMVTSKEFVRNKNNYFLDFLLNGIFNKYTLDDLKDLIKTFKVSVDKIEDSHDQLNSNTKSKIDLAIKKGILIKVGNGRMQSSTPPEQPENKKPETLDDPVIDIWINNQPVVDGKIFVDSDQIQFRWDIENATAAFLGKNNIPLKGSNSIKLDQINSKYCVKAVNQVQGNEESRQLTTCCEIVLKVPKPKFNYLEINQIRNTQFTFNKGEKITLSWNVTNANSILLNGEYISNNAQGMYALTVEKNMELSMTAINELLNIAETTNSRTIKIFARGKPDCPSIDRVHINGISVEGKNVFECTVDKELILDYKVSNCRGIIVCGEKLRNQQGKYPIPNDCSKLELETFGGEGMDKLSIRIDRIKKQQLTVRRLTLNGVNIIDRSEFLNRSLKPLFLECDFENCTEIVVNGERIKGSRGTFSISQESNPMNIKIAGIGESYDNKPGYSKSVMLKQKLNFWQRLILFLREIF